MPTRTKIEALVLSRRNIGEADRLVTFFTRERGLLKAVAKGVRRIPSSRGGHLEPFTRVIVLITESRAGLYVGGVETQEYFEGLRDDEVSLHHARNMILVVKQLFDEQDPQPQLFDAILNSWRILPNLRPAKRHLMESSFMLAVLQEAGLMPDLRVCQGCGISKPLEAVVFGAGYGGWRCLSCQATLQGAEYSLSPRLFAALRFIADRPGSAIRLKVEEEESSQLLQAVRKCVADLIESPLAVAS